MEGMGCGGGERTRTLADYLPVVAWFVRSVTYGWVPRSKATDVGSPATADLAWIVMVDSGEARKLGLDVSDEDKATAAAAEAWAESLSDATVDAERGDYLHNLRAVARTGLVTGRTAGIAASMIVAYQRHVARERELAESAQRVRVDAYVGAVKQRVTFGLPQAVGKKGKPLKGAPVVLSTDPVWLEAVIGYESRFGYTTVVKFRSAEGHLLVWKSHDTGVTRADVGKRYTLSGTIKAHGLYNEVKQTVLTRCEVTAHEMQHAGYIEAEPDGAVIVDYLGSGELRGLREAEAYCVGLWTRYLLTGEAPTLDGVRASLASDAYHLDAGDQATAMSTMESHLDTIRAGAVPPLGVCRAVLDILREHHAEVIVPEAHR
jgi:hypothetical protein